MVRGLRISPLTEGILEEVVWERRLRMKEAQRPVTESKWGLMTGRTLLQRASAAASVGMIGPGPLAMADASAADKTKAFPDKFLWGCATAGHQVEGNNTNSDMWTQEHLPGSIFKEPSGDACDHYHLYPQDIAMVADLGFNTYRFSLEWARIEPEEGFFSNAELDHYRRMLDVCREHHLNTMLTYYHFSLPRWFAMKGGWENEKAADQYARFCERATKHLCDLVDYASTMNEPDIPQLLNWFNLPGAPAGMSISDMMNMALANVRQQLNAPEFSNLFLGDAKKKQAGLLAAHAKGREAMKSVRPEMPVGFNLAMTDDQAAPEDSHLEEKRADVYGPWLEAAKHCDYMAVE